eukprot:COSAG06_NODE_28681_length_570_cov_0.590234_1_plen_22_part_10
MDDDGAMLFTITIQVDIVVVSS